MARHKGSKFSFPLPRRKSHSKLVQDAGHDRSHELPSPSTVPLTPSFSSRYHHHSPSRHDHNPSPASSKAQRVLGTDAPPFRPSSKQTSAVPPLSPAYVTVTLSDTGSDYDARTASDFGPSQEYKLPKAVALSNRASSTILPPSNMAYVGSEPPASPSSTASMQLRPRASDSTMRSHYDARSSPLSISQQTSNSAVRDMALRKGKPPVVTLNNSGSGNSTEHYASSPLAHETFQDTDTHTKKNKTNNRRSNTPRLDLAKLFPKPRSNGSQPYDKGLLSPSKLVNSPTAMSVSSDYFPRPMERQPTPTPQGQSKLTKPRPQQNSSAPMLKKPTSLGRLHKRDQCDNAKINVRRPPPGIKHWFDGFDDDSDEMDEDDTPALHSPKPIKPYEYQQNNFSSGRFEQSAGAPKPQQPHVVHQMLDPRKAQYIHANSHLAQRLTSPSQLSLQSQSSQTTAKTKDSSLSRSNLQNSSVLSFSSSEDEGESDVDSNRIASRKKVPVRDSINIADHGDIVIGQAQAFPVRPPHNRKSSTGKFSVMSTSTTAATIEVMYTPEPYSIQQFPRPFGSSNQSTGSSRRSSSHVRQQPSIIREAESEDARPQTAVAPQSPSSRSIRTSTSEPRSRLETQKFMAVTPEEEALLEALRKKRAAMAQQSWVNGYATAIKNEEVIRQITPPESKQKSYRTSAFLSIDSPPSQSPVRVVDAKKPNRKTPAPIQTPLASSLMRSRSAHAKSSSGGRSIGGDSSYGDISADRPVPTDEATLAHRLSRPEFSPLDLFPSPSNRLSVISQSTADHLSLPSPVTPGLRHGESEVVVKVASSEPSMNSDNDDVAVLETGVLDPPSGSIKPDDQGANHRRRRTASSGTDVAVPALQKSSLKDLRPVSEASSRASHAPEPVPSLPSIPRKSSLRKSQLSVSTSGLSNRHNSVSSSRTSSPARNHFDRRTSRSSRGSHSVSRIGSMGSLGSTTSIARNSISDDVLAAWGSLGGNYDGPRA
ncbi:hypothetical protein DM02DRAFT_397355 [Periconia macrospinosa]|uniref:Uncharacterized protein n=1 Tax=Periconia macrospinosa TaxID=97972 RepID=A0A2V1DQ34_9PLEO|nr:hypothetical protein DM02DRAFT_397355 [Periconia macrospinosa]